MSGLVEEGRAKVNLTLRVVGRRTDGYHDLESVVAFADCADKLTLTPGPELSLQTVGPLAMACGELSDNLVLKAARLLGEVVPDLKAGAFVLDKILPVAAGIGGGSADAAAGSRPVGWEARAVTRSFMPHLGQRPGSSLVTSGCIGQAYRTGPCPGAVMSSISAISASVLSGGASSQAAKNSRSAASSGAVRSTSNCPASEGVADSPVTVIVASR